MTRDIRLILSDIDGTILDSQHQLDSGLFDVITDLKESSIPFILASARSPQGIFPIVEELNLADSPIAAYNGALIVEGKKEDYQILIEHGLNKSDVKRILDLLAVNYPHISVNIYSGSDWMATQLDRWVEIEAAITKENPQLIEVATLLEDSSKPIHKLLLIAETEEIQDFFTDLQEIPFEDTSFYLSKDNYLEVTSQSVSKENALLEMANYYQVPLEETMAIGDNFNDLPMLTLAGLGVAMGNAPEAVKQGADCITLSNLEQGASKAIKLHVLD